MNGKGKLFIRELEAAPGYELDKEYKTVYVRPGKAFDETLEYPGLRGACAYILLRICTDSKAFTI